MDIGPKYIVTIKQTEAGRTRAHIVLDVLGVIAMDTAMTNYNKSTDPWLIELLIRDLKESVKRKWILGVFEGETVEINDSR